MALGRDRKEAVRATVLDGLLGASVMVIVIVTLVAATARLGHRSANLVPFRSITQLVTNSVDASIAIRNVLLNVLLFVPFGFFFARRLDKRLVFRTAFAGLCLALAIEVIQFVFLPGRVVDIDDVLLNVLGSMVGAVLAAGVAEPRARSENR